MLVKIGYGEVSKIYFPITINLKSNPHWLICGDSGSGKSVLTLYLLYSLQKIKNLEIFICDFKNSGDYYGTVDEDHFATFDKCIDMVDEYYSQYQSIRNNNSGRQILLIFDEWASFCIWVNNYDKKTGKRMLDQMSELLMLGRELPNGGMACIWHILQRPDAAYYQGARNNFFVTIVMKNVNKSIRLMLDIDSDEIPEDYIPATGAGIAIYADKIIPFKAPQIDKHKLTDLLKAKQREDESRADK